MREGTEGVGPGLWGGSAAGLAGGARTRPGWGAEVAGAPGPAGTLAGAAWGLGRCGGLWLRASPRSFFAAPSEGS